jgi:16S rRNA C967 or C1407 C5-methylase (RsmB/RsmF family)/NOL1/NOP2/fmu family ribosome biogenesis protein
MKQHPIYAAYEAVIPDKEKQHHCWQSRLPKTFWVNTLRINLDDFEKIIQTEGLGCEPVRWARGVYRVTGDFNPTKHWAYAAGLLQMQEEAAMHCAYLLDPKPGELILDCCAAPGNKSAQLAVMMQNKGTLIVNDMNFGRMRAFGQISKRLGLMNVSSCIYNATNLPAMPNTFDAVMVDVPCTCEGTFRKKWPKPQNPVSEKNARAQAKRQLAILNKAIQITKPGGRLVYSTCTFSPYENEGVITAALEEWGDQLRVLPIDIEHFETAAGLTQWQAELFSVDCEKTTRVWPHQNNTGGFYMALLQKHVSSDTLQKTPPSLMSIEHDKKELDLTPIVDRFGFAKDLFNAFHFNQASYKGWTIAPNDHAFPENLRLDASGLFFYKTAIRFPKLSTAAAMVFGKYAAKNCIELDAQGRDLYLAKEDQVITPEQKQHVTDTGYVLVFYQGFCLGVGLYFSPHGDQAPENQHRLRSLVDRKLAN